MKLHTPTAVTYAEHYPLDTAYSVCASCGEDIEKWEMDDDDMGLFWTKWGIRKGGTLVNTYSCGVSSLTFAN